MATQTNDRDPIAPSDEELTKLAQLAGLLARNNHGLSIVSTAGEEAALPQAALDVLRRAVAALARDQVVFLSATTKDLRLDQVEAMVDLPRAELVKLIDEGLLATTASHGMPTVLFEDALLLKQRRDDARREALRFLTRQGQEIESLLEAGSDRAAPDEIVAVGRPILGDVRRVGGTR